MTPTELTASGGDSVPRNSYTRTNQRDAWLRALENQGLMDAMRQVRYFEEGAYRGQSTTAQPSPPNQAMGENANQNGPGVQTSRLHSLNGSQPGGLDTADDFQIVSNVPRMDASTRFQNSITAIDDAIRSYQAGRASSSPRERPEPVRPVSSEQPAQSKITLIKKPEGIEVWVRDASLETSYHRRLCHRIADALASVGLRLRQFAVNGKSINLSGGQTRPNRIQTEK